MKQDSLSTIIKRWKILKKEVHSSLMLGDQTLEMIAVPESFFEKTYSCQQQQQQKPHRDALLIYKMTVSKWVFKSIQNVLRTLYRL
jgi:hypothetical protein